MKRTLLALWCGLALVLACSGGRTEDQRTGAGVEDTTAAPSSDVGTPSRDTAADTGTSATLEFLWHDVTAGLARRYDFIVTNPPFHAHDRADRPELGQRFIEVAAQALRPGGRLFLVANRHLPYEHALSAHFAQIRVLAQQGGFKAIEALRSMQ